MSDKIIAAKLQLDGAEATKTVGSFKQQLRAATQDLHNMSAEFGETSTQALAAAKRVAELRDNVGDMNSLVAAFNPDRKFVAFGQAVQGIVGGFTALQGAMGLMGVESENVQKQLLKVQSALALTQGLDNIRDSVQGFKNLASVIGNQVVKAFSTLKGAIIATGLGALLVALGTLIANFDAVKEAIFGVDRATKRVAENAAKAAEAEHEKLETLKLSENSLRLQGKSESEILKLKIAQTNEEIAKREQQLQASIELEKSQYEAAKRNHDILKGFINFITKPTQWFTEQVIKFSNWLGITKVNMDEVKKSFDAANDKISGWLFDPEEVKQDGEAALAEMRKQIAQLKSERDGFVLTLNKETEKNKPDAEFERLKNLDLGDPSKDPAVLAEQAKTDLILGIRKGFTQSIINEDNLRTSIENANSLQRKYSAEQEALARIAAAGAIGNALGTLSDLIGKQTAVGKALGIAQATINTWIGVSEVLRAKSVIPEPFGTIAKIANVTAIIASGLVAIKNIAKTQVPGGGGGGGGSAPSLPVPSPLAAIAQRSGGAQLDQNGLNNQGNATVRAFVLENDVTTNQERVTRLNRAARIA